MLKNLLKLCLIFALITVIGLLIGLSLKNKAHKEDLHIGIYGKDGVCLVTEKRLNENKAGSLYYSVSYEYEVNGVTYCKTRSFYHYIYAIVGMKYRVKYLEEKPKKSIILLDQPIISEYQNIEEERKKMKATGKYGRGLENAEPIESIKARYPEYFR